MSRHKFEGLVGHDLIWCLYCDWMTGIWSLGTEMLRNVESSGARSGSTPQRSANRAIDFPDLDNGWAKANGNMTDVDRVPAALLPRAQRRQLVVRTPRLTVNGEDHDWTDDSK